mgnify:CR=1 FL=1
MSLSEPRLAWSVAFVPSAFLPIDAPAWPSLITEVAGNVTAPTVDPVTHILHGPIPRAALARGVTDAGLHFVVGGVGSGITLTLTDHVDGEVDALDLGAMRARLASALLGLEVPARGAPAGEMAATPDRLGALLAERFDGEPGWRFVGLVEVSAVLQEGVASTLPDGDGWVDQGDLRIGRATGIGAGHAAWTLSGYWTTKTQRSVLDRRLTVLLKGHLNRMSAFAQYGSHALVWGEAARSAMRLSSALDGIIADVRMAASWKIAGGPLPAGQEPDFDRLAARLEVARVRLREEIVRLVTGGDRLIPSAERVLGEGATFEETGPFLEASSRAGRLVAQLEAREQAADRWAAALRVAAAS